MGRLGQLALEGSMIGACRLIDDTRTGLPGPVQERPVAGFVIGKAPVRAVTETVGIEMVFRNIDSDGIAGHLSLVLCLSSAA